MSIMGPKPWIRKVWTSRGHLLAEKRAISMVLDVFLSSLSGNRQVELIRTEISGRCLFCRSPKGQLISKRLLEKIVCTKIVLRIPLSMLARSSFHCAIVGVKSLFCVQNETKTKDT